MPLNYNEQNVLRHTLCNITPEYPSHNVSRIPRQTLKERHVALCAPVPGTAYPKRNLANETMECSYWK